MPDTQNEGLIVAGRGSIPSGIALDQADPAPWSARSGASLDAARNIFPRSTDE
ncbi:MAG TPA: hypothetical protein VGM73_05620 [Candidatus Didemnitutus sp.]|jgi:hypothetical protein